VTGSIALDGLVTVDSSYDLTRGNLPAQALSATEETGSTFSTLAAAAVIAAFLAFTVSLAADSLVADQLVRTWAIARAIFAVLSLRLVADSIVAVLEGSAAAAHIHALHHAKGIPGH